MNGRTDAAGAQIVAEFADLVKRLEHQAQQIQSHEQIQQLERSVRADGTALLSELLGQLLQSVVDRRQQALRDCECGARRRHQGVRPRKVSSSMGTFKLRGIYFKCMTCGDCRHSVDTVAPEAVTSVMRDMVLLAGVCSTSFDKGQVVLEQLAGVRVDDEAVRQACLREGHRRAGDAVLCPRVSEGDPLVGSCDGTMVHTRENNRWREIKAMRFEHAGGVHSGAFLESADAFTPRLKHVAQQLGSERAGRCVFVSDCAEWIIRGVAEHLPGFVHVADYYHAAQHVHAAGEAVYGKESLKARRWSRHMSRRLRERGAVELSDKLRRLALFYPDPEHQRAVLDLCGYLDKHASKMDYGRFGREKIPIDSGAMESFCKQLGLRMKGRGMRWSVRNVTAMARLVSRWSSDPKRAFTSTRAA